MTTRTPGQSLRVELRSRSHMEWKIFLVLELKNVQDESSLIWLSSSGEKLEIGFYVKDYPRQRTFM
ncbi:hypothetical protein HPP92_027765 [Vanilla planifolia]|uniref:Uncharacterized protein n=1 Tax=Vanilla planifolia TaxID=51239 RepID=A0A835P7T5_VANPL|nr:hypothetical protein HPP92_027765 [Vanilla planifolia]